MDDIPLLHDLYVAMSRALPRPLRGYLDPVLILVLAAALGVLARVTLFRWLRRLTAATKSPYDDIIVANLTRRVIAWTILGTLYWQMEEMPWRPRTIVWGQDIVAAMLVVSATFVVVRMMSASVTAYGLTRAAGVGGTTLVRYIAAAVLLFTGAVSVLALFDVSVVPAITALGIGGLAVALAFQDTLANVFSGLNLTLSRQIRVGDYVELDGGKIEGFVVDIGWRATTLRALTGLQIFIPNKKLAETVMINYTRDPGMAIELAFRTSLDADPERVEAVVLAEMVEATTSLPGIRVDAPALIRFREFGEWGLEWRVYVEILSYQDRSFLRHELMKRLHRRLRAEDIRVPTAGLAPPASAA